jgi:heme A synthase
MGVCGLRSAYRVIAYLLAVEVLVQGMAIAYALAAMGHWVDEDGGVVDKQLFDSDNPDFPGVGGFMIHGLNGTMIIPILVLLLVIVSFFAKVPGGVKRATIILGLVVLQVVLGIASHSVPGLITLHVLNAFGIFLMAAFAGYRAGAAQPVPAPAKDSVAV